MKAQDFEVAISLLSTLVVKDAKEEVIIRRSDLHTKGVPLTAGWTPTELRKLAGAVNEKLKLGRFPYSVVYCTDDTFLALTEKERGRRSRDSLGNFPH